jgi:transmembrane sensor
MNPEVFRTLLSKYLEGTASPTEELFVEKWYNSIPDAADLSPDEAAIIGARIYTRVKQRIAPAPRIFFLQTLLKVAAILVLIVGGIIFYYNHSTPVKEKAAVLIKPGSEKAVLQLADGTLISLDSAATGSLATDGGTQIVKLADGTLSYQELDETDNIPVTYNEMRIPAGGYYKLRLPDGSLVWLNAVSAIRYPTRFTDKERKVFINGEAYFEVAPDKQKPFIVEVPGKQQITVLGTHFNVSAYEDEQDIKTTLLEGAVQVNAPTINKPMLLKPGQQAILHSDGGIETRESVDVEQAVAWKNGYFQFERTEISTIIRQLSRWYEVDIVVAPGLNGQTFSGKIPRKENIYKLLDIFEQTNIIRYTTEGKQIKIFPRK